MERANPVEVPPEIDPQEEKNRRAKKAVLIGLGLSLFVPLMVNVDFLLNPKHPTWKEVVDHTMSHISGLGDALFLIFIATLLQEVVARFPARLAIFGYDWLKENFGEKFKDTANHLICWVAILTTLLIPTFYWATGNWELARLISESLKLGVPDWVFANHYYPVTVFCYGLIWGGVMIYTRRFWLCWAMHAFTDLVGLFILYGFYQVGQNYPA